MKVQILLPLSIAVAVASFGLMKIRLKEVLDEEKRATFQDVKLRVTGDVVSEYVKEKENTERRLEEATKEQKEMETALSTLEKTGVEAKKAELESCKGKKKTSVDEVASLEQQLQTFEADTPKERTAWETEVAALKEKLTAPSPLCNYLKAGASAQGLNCPEKKEPPKQEEPKVEEKKEPPKEEANKPEEPKPEAPKQEEPKPEAPKQEEQKAEAPKQ